MGIATNEESMTSKKRVAIVIDNTNTIEEIEVEVMDKLKGEKTPISEGALDGFPKCYDVWRRRKGCKSAKTSDKKGEQREAKVDGTQVSH